MIEHEGKPHHTAIGMIVAALFAGLLAPPQTHAASPASRCEKAAGSLLLSCVKGATQAHGECYQGTGAPCTATDPQLLKQLDKITNRLSKKCRDADVQAAGFGTMTVADLAVRLRSACKAETASLAARSFGGPHGAALAAQNQTGKSCLHSLYTEGSKFLANQAKTQMTCVDKQRRNGNCDTVKTARKLARLETKATAKIADACDGANPIAGMIALNTAEFLSRTSAQSRCMTAIAHPDVAPLDLDCGPRDDIDDTLQRGVYKQIILDQTTWGTKCGDGSDFAFWIRLAPQGEPVENIVLQMQGGGVCIFEGQCNSVSADLLEALSENAPSSGIMSNDPQVSPFANWTKIYLPYCNQDVFIGGGATQVFSQVTIERYGALNVRAALRYLRDAIWRELDATTNEGYRPDRIRFLFGGTSAGGFGTLYNYHYVLDDLQWVHTAAWPDASLSLDNGEVLGVGNLGLILIGQWNAGFQLPPYCFGGTCAVGPNIYAASAPRLKAVPEQQFLVLSNQVDNTQVGTTFFADLPDWLNTARQSYCDTMGTNGLKYFLPAITNNTHVIATRENLYTGYSVDGILMKDWLDLAMADGDTLFDAVEEGTLVADYPGVNAFPCVID